MIKLHARKCRFCSTEFTESELESHIAESRSKKQAEQAAEKTALEHARKEEELRVNRELAKSQNCLLTAIKARDVPQLEILFSLGCDPNAEFDSGTCPLVYAVEKGDAGIVNVLLNAGAKIPKNSNLLHAAVRIGSVEILQALILHGANIDEKNVLGLTALKLAEKREPRYDDILGVLKDAPLRFPCPKCKTMFEVNQEFRGRQGTCRTCSTKVKVPS
jgi:ankyrin repeat protein